MHSSEFLRFYSSFFDITEVNSTFYGIPSHAMTKKWKQQTPPHFRFTAKLPRVITHENRLQRLSPHMESFLESVGHLAPKYFLTVVQLPPSLSFEEARPRLDDLESFLSGRYAIEGRHDSWFSGQAKRYLADRNICLVWGDVGKIRDTLPLTSDFVYLRVIGDRIIPDDQFGRIRRSRDADLKAWAERLERIRDRVSFAIVLANNHYEGFGPATASKLMALLGLEVPAWQTKDQKHITEF